MALPGSFDLSVPRFGRRHFLTGALGCGAALACAPQIFAAEFWNSKDPSTWTEQEIQALTTKSPWTREAVPNFKNPDDPTADPTGGPSVRGENSSRRVKFDPIYIRWESAQPILDALRAPLPAEFAGHYVISVTNLPIRTAPRGRGGETADDLLEGLQAGASLARGGETTSAGIARRNHIGGFLFGFSRDSLPLSPADREIVFRLYTGQLTISTKFDGKAMMYHGKLAV